MDNLPYEKKRYKATLRALSPIHIGGGTAHPACRYVVDSDNRKAYVLRESFAAARYSSGKVTATQFFESPSPMQVLPPTGPDRSRAVLYMLRATKSAADLNKQVQPFIRNGFGEAYIPGTSLKGPIRQALLFSYLRWTDGERRTLQKELERLIHKMKNATPQTIRDIRNEKSHRNTLEAFFRSTRGERPDPKNDVLRCLSVSDSTPLESSCTLAPANILTLKEGNLAPMIQQQRGRGPSSPPPLFLELMDPGAVSEFTITVDHGLLETLNKQYGQKIQVSDHWSILSALKDQSDYAGALEKTFFSEFDGSGKLWKEEYEGKNLEDNEVIIRIGWGCGWMGHSLFPLFAYGENDVAESPKSRKTLVSGKGTPRSLFGYAVLKITEA